MTPYHLAWVLRRVRAMAHGRGLSRLREDVAARPLDPVAHRALARGLAHAGRADAAHAVECSARFLEGRTAESPPLDRTTEFLDMDHNQFHRFRSLSQKVRSLAAGSRYSILDVGGGDGQLSQFLPEADYVLAEPTVNGLSGRALPFAPDSFDYVVACHVLEHIPFADREAFLDSLLSRARRALVLLNPFEDAAASTATRLDLFVSVTKAGWAREHLQCRMPTIASVKEFAQARNLETTVEPNGFMPCAAALEFSNYFAKRLGRGDDLDAINRYFNALPAELVNVEGLSNAMMFVLSWRPPSTDE